MSGFENKTRALQQKCMWCFGSKIELCTKCFGNGCPACNKGYVVCTWCGGTGIDPVSMTIEEQEEAADRGELNDEEEVESEPQKKLARRETYKVAGMKVTNSKSQKEPIYGSESRVDTGYKFDFQRMCHGAERSVWSKDFAVTFRKKGRKSKSLK